MYEVESAFTEILETYDNACSINVCVCDVPEGTHSKKRIPNNEIGVILTLSILF